MNFLVFGNLDCGLIANKRQLIDENASRRLPKCTRNFSLVVQLDYFLILTFGTLIINRTKLPSIFKYRVLSTK